MIDVFENMEQAEAKSSWCELFDLSVIGDGRSAQGSAFLALSNSLRVRCKRDKF